MDSIKECVEDTTDEFKRMVAVQTEAVLKTQMIGQHLTLADMRVIRLEDKNETELFVNLRDKRVFLKRWFEYNLTPEKIVDLKNKVTFHIELVDEEMNDELYKSLVAFDSPKLRWVWDNMKHIYKIPFNDKHDIARVTWKRDDVWTIEVVGVMKEYIAGFKLEDVEAVLKLAETKITQTITSVSGILQRSLK